MRLLSAAVITLPRVPLATALALAGAAVLCAGQPRPNNVAQRYQQLCANCHGDKLQGGQAGSLLDDVWTAGADDAAIERSIRQGFPEKGMPAWGSAIPDKEIRAMVIYIREQRALHAAGQLQFAKPADFVTARSQLHEYQVSTWVGGMKEPYSLAFLKPDLAIATEKRGHAFLIEKGKLAPRPLLGLPAVDTGGQAGLYDVVPHPDYARNGWVYFAFSDPQRNAKGEHSKRLMEGLVHGVLSLRRSADSSVQRGRDNCPEIRAAQLSGEAKDTRYVPSLEHTQCRDESPSFRVRDA
jgi:cytochrome c5